MSKKSLERKEAQKFIADGRELGKSDQDIYNELTQQYYDKKAAHLLCLTFLVYFFNTFFAYMI